MMEPIPGKTPHGEEHRLARLTSAQAGDRLAAAPIAYVPVGSIEFHGPHLPLGVDMATAEGVCLEAARQSGGVVLPPIYLANGCLDLPHTLDFDPSLVESWTRAVVAQLRRRGARTIVLLTGHGPLDLIHLLKRVAREMSTPESPVYGLCWLELNAARLDGPHTGEPTVIDHASTVETSWMLALQPELVDLAALPDDPAQATLGVYGANPRFTASPGLGADQIAWCASLLAHRAASLGTGDWEDTGQDLGLFVDCLWSEPLQLSASLAADGVIRAAITNPGRASRQLSGLRNARIGSHPIPSDAVILVNNSAGESGIPVTGDSLAPESGLYVRRGQTLDMIIPSVPVHQGDTLTVSLELGGVRTLDLEAGLHG